MSEQLSADRRVQRTRHALLMAFSHLVQERRYDDVRVGDIIDKAGVGRSTFYDHYQGKDDILRQSMAGPWSLMAGMIAPGHDQAQLVALIEHFWENRRLARILFNGPTIGVLKRGLAEAIEARLGPIYEAAQAPPAIPAPLLAVQLAEACCGLLTAWFSGQPSCPAAVIADTLYKTTTATVSAVCANSGGSAA